MTSHADGPTGSALEAQHLVKAHDIAMTSDESHSLVSIAISTLRAFGFRPLSPAAFSNEKGDSFSFVQHSPDLIVTMPNEISIE